MLGRLPKLFDIPKRLAVSSRIKPTLQRVRYLFQVLKGECIAVPVQILQISERPDVCFAWCRASSAAARRQKRLPILG
jgi:hypothetical protein